MIDDVANRLMIHADAPHERRLIDLPDRGDDEQHLRPRGRPEQPLRIHVKMHARWSRRADAHPARSPSKLRAVHWREPSDQSPQLGVGDESVLQIDKPAVSD